MVDLVDFFHFFAAADKDTAPSLRYHYFIPANITPVLLADFFNAHVQNVLSLI